MRLGPSAWLDPVLAHACVLLGCERPSEIVSGRPIIRQLNVCCPVTTLSGERYVLKISRGDGLKEREVGASSSRALLKEKRLYEVLRQHTTLPVPKVLGIDVCKGPVRAAYMVMEALPGVGVREVFWEVSSSERRQMVRIIAHALREIHSVRLEGVVDFVSPAWVASNHAYKMAQLRRSVEQVKSRAFHDATLTSAVWRVLEDPTLFGAETQVLLHNDFGVRANNLLLERREGAWTISGLLDLERARIGSPLEDLVRVEADLTKSVLVSRQYRNMWGEEPLLEALREASEDLSEVLFEAYGVRQWCQATEVHRLFAAAVTGVEALRV